MQHTPAMHRASRASWQNFEAVIDSRRKWTSLSRAAERMLPDHIMLLTPEPKQAVFKGLVKRVFALGYECKDGTLLHHVEEHNDRISDETQLAFALAAFEQNLKAAQLVG